VNAKSGRPRPSDTTLTPDSEPEGAASTAESNPDPAAETAAPATPEEPAISAAPSAETESAADYKDRWMRSAAELQNYRRRAQREIEEARRIAEERVLLEIIAAIDDLDRALDSAREANAPRSWTEGVQLVMSRLVDYLARQGVVALDPIGEPFNPEFHEAMLEVEAPDAEPGHVVQTALRGYRRGPRALRPARVVVARRPPGSEL
jgi:molecular chaperone GrpE